MMKSIITKELKKYQEKIEELSIKTEFITRKVKITAESFVGTLTSVNSEEILSDERLCRNMQEDYKIDIKRQALNKRLHETKSVEYLKKITESLLENSYKVTDKTIKGLLSPFKNTYIEDNSGISLQEDVKEEFRGSGGNASKAGMKIYLNYNYTQKSIADLKITEGVRSDSKFTDRIISILKKGDLVLRDLGFFKIDSLKNIEEKDAYYLSRYFLATNLYINDKKIDLLEFLESKKYLNVIDEEVQISTKKLSTRLIAIRVSDKIYNERVRKLKKAYQRRRKNPKKETLKLQRYVIFITNIPKDMIEANYIGTIYRIRWEIELCFKRWKSILKIDRLTGTNGNRTLCFIYAKLIAIILINNFKQYALTLAYQRNRELSTDKFFKWILDRDRFQRLLAKEFSVTQFLEMISNNITRLFKDKRLERLSSLDLILTSASFYYSDDGIYLGMLA